MTDDELRDAISGQIKIAKTKKRHLDTAPRTYARLIKAAVSLEFSLELNLLGDLFARGGSLSRHIHGAAFAQHFDA